MIKKVIELCELTAEEGMTLTDGSTYGKTIYLGSNDTVENWHEIPDGEVPVEEEHTPTIEP